jgi:hypothetical protein
MRLASRRGRAGKTPAIARKAKAPPRQSMPNAALEQQADRATARAMRGEIGVARMLADAGPASIETPSSPGQALPSDVRATAETAFGADFAPVRVHRDPVAASAAAHERARAFTAGRDIYFAESEWQPTTTGGRELLYHELAHVVQQTGRRDGDDVRTGEREGKGFAQARPRRGRSR